MMDLRLYLIMLLLPQLLQAQIENRESLPLLELGRSWNYVRTNADGTTDDVSLQIVKIENDEDIYPHRHYYKLAYCTPEDTIARFMLRQCPDEDCVLGYDLEDNMREEGFLPYGLQIGDSSYVWTLRRDGSNIISRQQLPGVLRMKDLVSVDGCECERLYFYSEGSDEPCDVWIHGVGSQKSGILPNDRKAEIVGEDSLTFVSCTDADNHLVFSSTDFSSQRIGSYEYHPLLEQGKVWYCVNLKSDAPYSGNLKEENINWYFQYFIDGDTLIDGKNCYKVFGSNHYLSHTTEYLCAMYEEEGRVWIYESGSADVRLLYDFTAEVGDQLFISFERIKGPHRTTTKIGDQYLPLFDHSRHCHVYDKMYLYEGIGPETGLLIPTINSLTGALYQLLLCTVGGEVIFDSGRLKQEVITSVKATGKMPAETDGHNYDLSGRRMSPSKTVIPKGVYIQGGKKFVIK